MPPTHPERDPVVDIRAVTHDEEVEFIVSDNGIGLDPRHLDQVFAIFHRLHPVHRFPGTGMGLALCRRIVERHGGRIWATSVLGTGCSSHVTLPWAAEGTEEGDDG